MNNDDKSISIGDVKQAKQELKILGRALKEIFVESFKEGYEKGKETDTKK